MDDRAAAVMDKIWQDHGDDMSWVFCSHPSQFGDFYLSMSVFHNFRFLRGGRHGIRLLVGTPGHRAIARLFCHLFSSIHYVPELAAVPPLEMQVWSVERRRAQFAPGSLIWLHPFYFCFPQFEIASLINRGRAKYSELCRLGYRLPFELASMPPTVTAGMREGAQTLAARHQIVPGRTLVLFPYARSVPQDCTVHFVALAEQATQAGYHVMTSVAGQEQPIAGTAAVHIPFDLLIPFCELAGHVVAIKSGIGDILATARCAKIFVYRNEGDIDMFSVVDSELGGNAKEIAFDFSQQSVPDFLAACDRWQAPTCADLINSVPRPVARYIAAHQADVRSEMSLANPPYVHPMGKYRGIGGIVLGNGWSGLEGWGAWSIGHRAFVYLGNPYADLVREADGECGITVHLDIAPALNERHIAQQIHVMLGGATATFNYEGGTPHPAVALTVPAAVAAEACFKIIIDIRLPQPPDINPRDPRLLGIGLKGVQIRMAQRTSVA